MAVYNFAIGGAFTGSISGSFSETNPQSSRMIVGMDQWRDLSRVEPEHQVTVSASVQLQLTNASYMSRSFNPNATSASMFSAPLNIIGDDFCFNGADMPQAETVLIPGQAWVSGNAFTVYADVYRPDNARVLLVPNQYAHNTASYMLTASTGLFETTSFTISPFTKKNATSFQSNPGTGESSPITITFSDPVFGVTVAIGDPTFAGNTMQTNAELSSFAFSGIPGYDVPDSKTHTGSITTLTLTPAAADYVYYTVIVYPNAASFDPNFDPLARLNYLRTTLPESLANRWARYPGMGSGIGISLGTGSMHDFPICFWWSDYPTITPSVETIYSGSNAPPLFYGVDLLDNEREIYPIEVALSNVDGTFASSSNDGIYWPQGTWKRMGIDILARYEPDFNVQQNDISMAMWIADAFTGDSRATLNAQAFYRDGTAMSTLLNYWSGYNINSVVSKMISGTITITPMMMISNVTSGSADWRFRNLTVVDNFRGVVTGSIDGILSGSFNARFHGQGRLTGSAVGLFTGELDGGYDGTITAPEFQRLPVFPYNAAGTFAQTYFGGNLSVIGANTYGDYNDFVFPYDYYYYSIQQTNAPSSSFFFDPPVRAVTIEQVQGAAPYVESGTISAYNSAGALLSQSYFSADQSSTRTMSSSVDLIARIDTKQFDPSKYTYFSGPYIALYPFAYSGSFSGSMVGYFEATSSFVFIPVIPTVPTLTFNLGTVKLKYSTTRAPSNRRGLVIYKSSGSPHLSLEPVWPTSSWHLPGDIWFAETSGSGRGLFYAEYSASVIGPSSSIVPWKIWTTTASVDTLDGGTF